MVLPLLASFTVQAKNLPLSISAWQAVWGYEDPVTTGSVRFVSPVTSNGDSVVFASVPSVSGQLWVGVLQPQPPLGIDLHIVGALKPEDGDVWEYDYFTDMVKLVSRAGIAVTSPVVTLPPTQQPPTNNPALLPVPMVRRMRVAVAALPL